MACLGVGYFDSKCKEKRKNELVGCFSSVGNTYQLHGCIWVVCSSLVGGCLPTSWMWNEVLGSRLLTPPSQSPKPKPKLEPRPNRSATSEHHSDPFQNDKEKVTKKESLHRDTSQTPGVWWEDCQSSTRRPLRDQQPTTTMLARSQLLPFTRYQHIAPSLCLSLFGGCVRSQDVRIASTVSMERRVIG